MSVVLFNDVMASLHPTKLEIEWEASTTVRQASNGDVIISQEGDCIVIPPQYLRDIANTLMKGHNRVYSEDRNEA